MARYLLSIAFRHPFNTESAWLAFLDGFTDAATLCLLISLAL